MSQQEFETYLALLTRLLRINPQQREQVAEEFRSHMEDRLDDLLARGISREQAIQTALEEFGDAAALAGQVAKASWNRKRRWYMKVSAFSVASLAAAVLLAVALWPENQRLPATGRAIAQQPAGGAAGGGDAPAQPDVKATLEQKLAERLDADFVEIPLRDVLAFLADQAQVQFYVNRRALEEEAASDDAPISLKLKNVRLETVLDLALEQANPNLAYQERDGVLIISTLQALEGATEVRVYNCRDLLAMTSPDPAEMMMGGGMGGMGGMDGMMMRGMPRMGAEMGMGMPGMMRGGRGRAGAGGGASMPAADPIAPGEGGAGAAAPGEVPQPADPAATPSDPGAEPAKAKAPKGRKGARRAPSLDLWQDRAILAQHAGGGMGGSMAGMDAMGGMGGGMGFASRPEPQTDHERRAERLMRLITTAVDPHSWENTGGFGTISEFEGLIVVNHSARAHKEIEKVLTMLREAAGLPPDAQGGFMGGAGMGDVGGGLGGAGGGGGIGVPRSP